MSNVPVKPEEGEDPDPLAEKLVESVRPFLRQDKLVEARQVMIAVTRKYHSGPLPAPESFEHYEVVLPGAAERIMRMAEIEQENRHATQKRIVTNEYATRYVGQAGALLALTGLIGCVMFCAWVGQPLTAAIIGAIGAIVVGFLKYSNGGRDDEPAPKPQVPVKRPPSKRRK